MSNLILTTNPTKLPGLVNVLKKLEDLKIKFAQRYQQGLINYCENIPTVNYTQVIRPPRCPGIYEYTLSKAFLETSLKVTQSNCINIVPIPNPPGFTQQYRLIANDPYDNARRMFATIFTDQKVEKALFVFTGTIFLDEWVNDFTFPLVDATKLNNYQPGIQVHKGFYDIYLQIRDQLWNFYQQNQSTIHEFYITGHSLGGGLSTICAFDFALKSPTHYSFAAPRSGNVAYAKQFNKILPTSLRIANTEDIIPDLPPPVLGPIIYEHTNTLITFTVNLGTIGANHVTSYLDYMPMCVANTAPCWYADF